MSAVARADVEEFSVTFDPFDQYFPRFYKGQKVENWTVTITACVALHSTGGDCILSACYCPMPVTGTVTVKV